jgi:WD40 repeat protein
MHANGYQKVSDCMNLELVRAFSVLRTPDGGMVSTQDAWVTFTHRLGDDTLACGYADGHVALWDLHAEREQRLLNAPDLEMTAYDPILSVAFGPDERLLVSTNHGRTPDRAAYLWDLERGELLYRLDGFHYRIYDAAFRPDGRMLALAGDDRVVKCFDVTTGTACPPYFSRLPYSISALAFSPDGRYLVAGCDGELLVIYDLVAGSERHLEGHLEWTLALAFSPLGHLFASGGEDERVCLWEVASGRRVRELTDHAALGKPWGGIVSGVAFSPDGALVASASRDMTARLWEVATGQSVAILPHSARDLDDGLSWVAFRPRGDELLTGSSSGQVSRWRTAPGRSGESGPAEPAQDQEH